MKKVFLNRVNQKGFAPILLIILIVLVVVIGGIFVLWQMGFVRTYLMGNDVKELTPLLYPSHSSPSPSSNWQIYIHPDNLYSISFPENLKYKELASDHDSCRKQLAILDSNGRDLVNGGVENDFVINIVIDVCSVSYATAQNNLKMIEGDAAKPTTFAGLPGMEKSGITSASGLGSDIGEVHVDRTIVSKGDLVYFIDIRFTLPESGSLPNNYQHRFDQIKPILSTFKFLDQTNISGWKTYQFSQFNLSTSYPSGWNATTTVDSDNVPFLDLTPVKNKPTNSRTMPEIFIGGGSVYSTSGGVCFDQTCDKSGFISIPIDGKTLSATIVKGSALGFPDFYAFRLPLDAYRSTIYSVSTPAYNYTPVISASFANDEQKQEVVSILSTIHHIQSNASPSPTNICPCWDSFSNSCLPQTACQ